jgi:hypothetical protein
MRKHICLLLLGWICALAGCSLKNGVNITPHEINGEADLFYREALRLSANYDVDTTLKSIQLLDSALSIDSLNPDYYGLKAKLLCELGYLDSALLVQERADRIKIQSDEKKLFHNQHTVGIPLQLLYRSQSESAVGRFE